MSEHRDYSLILAAVRVFRKDGKINENARLIAAATDLLAAADKIDHLSLVIESAVRNADNGNYNAVLFALKATRAAIAKASGP